MLTSIAIKRLRGIREGQVDGLAPLSIFVGPNGSGKSAVLEAMLIGAAADPASGAMVAIAHRTDLPHGARWLLWRGGQGDATAEINCHWSDKEKRTTTIRWTPRVNDATEEFFKERSGTPPYSQVSLDIPQGEHVVVFWFGIDAKGIVTPVVGSFAQLWHPGHDARLLDLGHAAGVSPLDLLYSTASRAGRKKDVPALVSAVVPNLSDMEILTEFGDPILYLHYGDGSISVPAALAGEGVKNLLRICMVLAANPNSTLLLEEPEAHLHPAALRQSALAIVETVRRGSQIVVSTHSIELIDALLAEHKSEELDQLAVFRTRLDNGRLIYSRIGGADVQLARETIGDDLR